MKEREEKRTEILEEWVLIEEKRKDKEKITERRIEIEAKRRQKESKKKYQDKYQKDCGFDIICCSCNEFKSRSVRRTSKRVHSP